MLERLWLLLHLLYSWLCLISFMIARVLVNLSRCTQSCHPSFLLVLRFDMHGNAHFNALCIWSLSIRSCCFFTHTSVVHHVIFVVIRCAIQLRRVQVMPLRRCGSHLSLHHGMVQAWHALSFEVSPITTRCCSIQLKLAISPCAS